MTFITGMTGTVHYCHPKEHIVWLHKSLYLQSTGDERGGGLVRLGRGAFIQKALWRARRKRLSGSGGTLSKTKPTSLPESPPVQPIKGLILIQLMIWILQAQPDYHSRALRGPHDYELSQVPSDKQTRVIQMSWSSKQRCPESYQLDYCHSDSFTQDYRTVGWCHL